MLDPLDVIGVAHAQNVPPVTQEAAVILNSSCPGLTEEDAISTSKRARHPRA